MIHKIYMHKQDIYEYIMFTIASIAMVIGIYYFKFPNHFSFGGISGLSIVLAALVPHTPGNINFIINMCLLMLGFVVFGLVVIVGIFIGMIRVPLTSKGFSGTTFSLTITGGVLLSGIVFSHFGHIGPISFVMDHKILEVFQELGLIFFLIGAGVPGGASFVKYFHPLYFVFGVIITIVPMIIGYIIEKKIIKLSLLDSLGAITGGMTSTPALGSLIKNAGTNDVASSYASTYPIALICVVLGAQLIILIFGG